MVTYTLNHRTGTLHRRVGGKSHESCNLDQLVDRRDYSTYPITGVRRECLRCFKGGDAPIEGAPV
jgi:hypothetical protein